MRHRRGPATPFLRTFTVLVVAGTALLCLLFYLSIAARHQLDPLPTALFVAVAALVGSAVNQPFRDDPLQAEQGWPWLYVVWKGAVAVAFAALLYLLLMGQLVSGGLFPAFRGGDSAYCGVSSFVSGVNPATNADFAKLLAWSFVAGFSEKLVPNLIARMETGAGHRDDSSPS